MKRAALCDQDAGGHGCKLSSRSERTACIPSFVASLPLEIELSLGCKETVKHSLAVVVVGFFFVFVFFLFFSCYKQRN